MKTLIKTIIRQPSLMFGLVAMVLVGVGLLAVLVLSRNTSENRSKAAVDQFDGRVYFKPTEQDSVPSTKDVLEMIPVAGVNESVVGKTDIKIDVSEPIIGADVVLRIGPENLNIIEVVNFVPNSGLFGGVSLVSPPLEGGKIPVDTNGRMRLLVATNKRLTVVGSERNLGNLQIKFKGPAPTQATLNNFRSKIIIESVKLIKQNEIVSLPNPSASYSTVDSGYKGTLYLQYALPNQAASALGTCQCSGGTVTAAANRCATNSQAVCVAANACGCVQTINCSNLRMTDINRVEIPRYTIGQTVGFKFTMNSTGQTPSNQWDSRLRIAQVKNNALQEFVSLGSRRFDPFNPSTLVQDLPFGSSSWIGVGQLQYALNFKHPITITDGTTNYERQLWCDTGAQWKVTDTNGVQDPNYTVSDANPAAKCTNTCYFGTEVVSGSTPTPTTGQPATTNTPTPIPPGATNTPTPVNTATPTPVATLPPVTKTPTPLPTLTFD